MEIYFKIIIGALLGAAISILSIKCANYCLSQRGLKQKNIDSLIRLIKIILTVLISAGLVLTSNTISEAIYSLLLMLLLETQLITDYEHRIIPNGVVFAALVLKLLFIILSLLSISGFPEFTKYTAISSLLGLVVMMLLFLSQALFGKSIGMGDIKLAGAIGFCVGLSCSLVAVAICGFLCLGYIIIQPYIFVSAKVMSVNERLKQMIPLGVALGIATELVMILNNVYPLAFIKGVI